MLLSEETLLPLGLILLVGLVMPDVLRRFQFPLASVLLVLGSIFGPHGLEYVQEDNTISFIGSLGAAFLMLLAGMESRYTGMLRYRGPMIRLLLINGLLPGLLGLGIARLYGYDWAASTLTGLLFLSSSIVMVYAQVPSNSPYRVDRYLHGLVAYADLLALLGLAVLLHVLDTSARFPVWVYLGLLASSIFLLRLFLPEVVRFFFLRYEKNNIEEEEVLERKVQLILALLMLSLVMYTAMGVEAVVAAFLVGFSLSSLDEANMLQRRLRTIGYSLFVPVFFFIVGMQMDASLLIRLTGGIGFIPVFVVSALLAKLITGYVGGRLEKLPSRDAWRLGGGSMIRLVTTLSVAFTARLSNLIDTRMLTAVVLLTILSALAGPLILSWLSPKQKKAADGTP
jgi:Kef-type K+ transport system membrane component KefB